MQQTARLLLLGSFSASEPSLTQTFRDLYKECSALFNSLLPKSEQTPEKDEPYVSIMEDKAHGAPAALSRLQAKHCRQVLLLPVQSTAFKDDFKRGLQHAYMVDYNMPGVLHLGNATVPWCKKLSFDDRYFLKRINSG